MRAHPFHLHFVLHGLSARWFVCAGLQKDAQLGCGFGRLAHWLQPVHCAYVHDLLHGTYFLPTLGSHHTAQLAAGVGADGGGRHSPQPLHAPQPHAVDLLTYWRTSEHQGLHGPAGPLGAGAGRGAGRGRGAGGGPALHVPHVLGHHSELMRRLMPGQRMLFTLLHISWQLRRGPCPER